MIKRKHFNANSEEKKTHTNLLQYYIDAGWYGGVFFILRSIVEFDLRPIASF